MTQVVTQSTTHSSSQIPNILTIAGSDSGGGAGIQADIKAISATGGFACSAITALTAQNTLGVRSIFPVSAEFIGQQLDAVFSDISISAVKIGMLNDSQIITAIAQKLRQYSVKNIVLDPVMVATSGDPLIQPEAIQTLKSEFIPLVDVITPNLPEAGLLLGLPMPKSELEVEDFIKQIQSNSELNQVNVLLKGGHFTGEQSQDWLIQQDKVSVYSHKRIQTSNTHGTGCTLSSALASYLGQGYPLTDAVTAAKAYLSQALVHANNLNVGQGSGPVDHFYAIHQACDNKA
ncbi:MAG: bifunctional hydroxymethylpyrimidine kinase/phosphomethylpyrimidine kinase [Vibrio sp.]